jgi:hypothetical protein
MMCGRSIPKRKRLLSPYYGLRPQHEPQEPDNLARFNHTQQRFNLITGLNTGPFPGIEEKIISTIKTIRKGN